MEHTTYSPQLEDVNKMVPFPHKFTCLLSYASLSVKLMAWFISISGWDRVRPPPLSHFSYCYVLLGVQSFDIWNIGLKKVSILGSGSTILKKICSFKESDKACICLFGSIVENLLRQMSVLLWSWSTGVPFSWWKCCPDTILGLISVMIDPSCWG